ncbi:MAG: cold shock domain-containing protein [Chloroflexia bacterium]|nr:cold shock domain-containing protein [Chloroflexia bacterium]
MANGIIVSLRDKGFGFIAPEGGPSNGDLFFHHTSVLGSFNDLREGQKVTYDQEPDPRDRTRQRAVNVATTDGGAVEMEME